MLLLLLHGCAAHCHAYAYAHTNAHASTPTAMPSRSRPDAHDQVDSLAGAQVQHMPHSLDCQYACLCACVCACAHIFPIFYTNFLLKFHIFLRPTTATRTRASKEQRRRAPEVKVLQLVSGVADTVVAPRLPLPLPLPLLLPLFPSPLLSLSLPLSLSLSLRACNAFLACHKSLQESHNGCEVAAAQVRGSIKCVIRSAWYRRQIQWAQLGI